MLESERLAKYAKTALVWMYKMHNSTNSMSLRHLRQNVSSGIRIRKGWGSITSMLIAFSLQLQYGASRIRPLGSDRQPRVLLLHFEVFVESDQICGMQKIRFFGMAMCPITELSSHERSSPKQQDITQYLPNSPHFALTDCLSFPKRNIQLSGHRFNTTVAIESESEKVFESR